MHKLALASASILEGWADSLEHDALSMVTTWE